MCETRPIRRAERRRGVGRSRPVRQSLGREIGRIWGEDRSVGAFLIRTDNATRRGQNAMQ